MFMKMFRSVNDVSHGGAWAALIALAVVIVSAPAWIFYPYTFTPGMTGAPTFIDVMQLTFFISGGFFAMVLMRIGLGYAMLRTVSSVIVFALLGGITIAMLYVAFGH